VISCWKINTTPRQFNHKTIFANRVKRRAAQIDFAENPESDKVLP
jgi:hypothetical protein